MPRVIIGLAAVALVLFGTMPAEARRVVATSDPHWWIVEVNEGCYVYWWQLEDNAIAAKKRNESYYKKLSWSGPCPKGKLASGHGVYFELFDMSSTSSTEKGLYPSSVECEMVSGLLEGDCTVVGTFIDGSTTKVLQYRRGCKVADSMCTENTPPAPPPPAWLVE